MIHLTHTIRSPPNVLHIPEHGRLFNIEIRGSRHMDNLWFDAQDCAKAFDFHDVFYRLNDIESSYQEGIHYQYFWIEGNVYATLFLSFLGVSGMLFNKRQHPISLHFQRWVTSMLLQEPKQNMINVCCVR